MNNNDEDQQPLYVLMTKDYRVSRSRRAKWFINNYLSRTTPSSLLNEVYRHHIIIRQSIHY